MHAGKSLNARETSVRMRYLLLCCVLLAAAFNGLSGSGMDRSLIEMPAWQHVGALAWAAFSRWADVGTNGLILYPIEKVGGPFLASPLRSSFLSTEGVFHMMGQYRSMELRSSCFVRCLSLRRLRHL